MMRKSVQPTIRGRVGGGFGEEDHEPRRTRIRTTMKATTPTTPPRTEGDDTPEEEPELSPLELGRASTSSLPSSSRSPLRSRTPIVT